MSGPRTSAFDLTFGPALRKLLTAAQREPATAGMIPGFLLGWSDDNETEHLWHGYYRSAKAEEEGLFELFEAEGIRFFTPQPQVRELLTGTHLDLDDKGRLVVQSRTA
jgi:hypothetical protein